MTVHGGRRLPLDDLPSFSKVPHSRVEKWREGALSMPGSQGKNRDGFLFALYISIRLSPKKANTDVTQVLILRGGASTGQGIKIPSQNFLSAALDLTVSCASRNSWSRW